MALLRLVLFLLLAFIVFKVVQVTRRIMSGGRQRDRAEDLLEKYRSHMSASQKFKDVKDADFEDLTDKEDSEKKDNPPVS